MLTKTRLRVWWYLGEAVPLFLIGTVLLFVLDRLGALGFIAAAGRPIVTGLLGLPPATAQMLVMGFLRRDYGAAGLFQLHRAGLLDPRQVAVSLVCITLFMPCFAQFLVTLREQGWKATSIITTFVFGYALGVAALVNWAWKALA